MKKVIIAIVLLATVGLAQASEYSKRLGLCNGIALQNSIPEQDLPRDVIKAQNQINIAKLLQQATPSARILDQTNQQDFNDYLIGRSIGMQAASFNGSAPARTGYGNQVMNACVNEFLR